MLFGFDPYDSVLFLFGAALLVGSVVRLVGKGGDTALAATVVVGGFMVALPNARSVVIGTDKDGGITVTMDMVERLEQETGQLREDLSTSVAALDDVQERSAELQSQVVRAQERVHEVELENLVLAVKLDEAQRTTGASIDLINRNFDATQRRIQFLQEAVAENESVGDRALTTPQAEFEFTPIHFAPTGVLDSEGLDERIVEMLRNNGSPGLFGGTFRDGR